VATFSQRQAADESSCQVFFYFFLSENFVLAALAQATNTIFLAADFIAEICSKLATLYALIASNRQHFAAAKYLERNFFFEFI